MKYLHLYLTAFLFSLLLITDCRCSKGVESQKNGDAKQVQFDLKRFESDREIQKMVLDTRFSEVIRRFGDALFEQTYSLEISSDRQKIELKNRDIIEQAKNGDYHLKSENSSGRMMEVFYVDKKLYVSMDGKKFFIHADDLVEARTKREKVYSQANSFLKTYIDYIRFVFDGEVEERLLRYKIELNKEAQKGGLKSNFILENIKGYILVDRRSGGIAGVDLEGTIKYENKSRQAISKFSIKSSIKRSSAPFVFKVPEVVGESAKLRIEKDLLQQLEKMEESVGKEEDQKEPE